MKKLHLPLDRRKVVRGVKNLLSSSCLLLVLSVLLFSLIIPARATLSDLEATAASLLAPLPRSSPVGDASGPSEAGERLDSQTAPPEGSPDPSPSGAQRDLKALQELAPPGRRYATRMERALRAELLGGDARVVDVNSTAGIQEFVMDAHRYVFLEFYAAWCSHCRKMMPVIEQVAVHFSNRSSEIRIAKINGNRHPAFTKEYGVSSYPTMILFSKGLPKQTEIYAGKRTEEAIIAWIELRITPPSIRPTPDLEAEKPERRTEATSEPLTLVIRRSSSTPTPTSLIDTQPSEHEEKPTKAPADSEVNLPSDLNSNPEEGGLEVPSSDQAPFEPTIEDHQFDNGEMEVDEEEEDEGEREEENDDDDDDGNSDEDEEYIVSFDGTELLLWTWFAPEPKGVVLFLHDLGKHCAHQPYLALYEHAHEQGMTVYCFDLRGHGGSDGIRGHINRWSELRQDAFRMLDIIHDDIEAQEEASSTVLDVPVVLIGHGLGGTLAMDVAMADSLFYDGEDEVEPAVDKVVVIDPLLSLDTHIKKSTSLLLSSDSLRIASSSLWPTLTVNVSQLHPPGSDQVSYADEDDVLIHDRATVRLVEETIHAETRLLSQYATTCTAPTLMLTSPHALTVPVSSMIEDAQHEGILILKSLGEPFFRDGAESGELQELFTFISSDEHDER